MFGFATTFANKASARTQAGSALFTVLILLLLCITAVMGAFRVGYLNEILVGNTADYSRARAAADAMVRDAEMDIRGRLAPYTTPNPDGSLGAPCRPSATDATLPADGYIGCRNMAGGQAWFPQGASTLEDFQDLQALVATAPHRCLNGICLPLNTADLANIETDLATFKSLGVRYGEFTQATPPANGATSNPLLYWTGTDRTQANAWYLVEAFLLDDGETVSTPLLDNVVPGQYGRIIYRITAAAQGIKPNTLVVLKNYFVPFPKAQQG